MPALIDLVFNRPLDLSDMIADALGVTPQADDLWGAGSLSASLIKHFSGDHAQQLRSWTVAYLLSAMAPESLHRRNLDSTSRLNLAKDI
jgi:hypothetical protein